MDEHDSRKEKLYLIGRSSNNLWTEGSEYKGRGASMGGDISANHLLTYLEKSIKSADSIDTVSYTHLDVYKRQSGANLRKSRGSREPRGSKLIHEGINYLSIRSGLARALWLKTPSYVKWP